MGPAYWKEDLPAPEGHSSGPAMHRAISDHPQKLMAELEVMHSATSAKREDSFSQQAGWGEFGSSCIKGPGLGPTVSARRHLTPCKGGQKAVIDRRSSKKVLYHLS